MHCQQRTLPELPLSQTSCLASGSCCGPPLIQRLPRQHAGTLYLHIASNSSVCNLAGYILNRPDCANECMTRPPACPASSTRLSWCDVLLPTHPGVSATAPNYMQTFSRSKVTWQCFALHGCLLLRLLLQSVMQGKLGSLCCMTY